MREPRAPARRHVRHNIGAGGVNRHARRHRRPPARVGAGVEAGVHLAGEQPARGVAAELGVDARGVALGGGGHALGARVDAGNRLAGEPGAERDERLHRHVELAAETAAASARDNAHLLRPQFHHDRGFVAVHVGRLRGDVDLDALADAPRPAGLRFDVGVLDESGFETRFRHSCAIRPRRHRIAATDAAIEQQVAGFVRLHARRIRRHGRRQSRDRRQRFPGHRETRGVEALERLACAHHGCYGLAPEARFACSEHGLVLDIGVNSETVRGHVGCGKHAHDSGAATPERIEVADAEARPMMRRAHHAQPERI